MVELEFLLDVTQGFLSFEESSKVKHIPVLTVQNVLQSFFELHVIEQLEEGGVVLLKFTDEEVKKVVLVTYYFAPLSGKILDCLFILENNRVE